MWQSEFLSFVTIWVFEFCQNNFFLLFELSHNLCFWVLSQFKFLSFVTIWFFEFCHNLTFQVLSQYVFLSFVTIGVFKFCHYLRFWVCHKGHLPSANLRQGGKTLSPTLIFTGRSCKLRIYTFHNPLRYDYSKHLVQTNMSVLDPVLYTYFEWMKMTSPSRQNIL